MERREIDRRIDTERLYIKDRRNEILCHRFSWTHINHPRVTVTKNCPVTRLSTRSSISTCDRVSSVGMNSGTFVERINNVRGRKKTQRYKTKTVVIHHHRDTAYLAATGPNRSVGRVLRECVVDSVFTMSSMVRRTARASYAVLPRPVTTCAFLSSLLLHYFSTTSRLFRSRRCEEHIICRS